MIKKKKYPLLWRRMWTKIANKLLNRKCGSCRYWHDYNNFCEGSCGRWNFFKLSPDYSWQNACEYYEGRTSK